jgi:hypothetical protein
MPKEAPFTHSLGNILQLLIVCDGFCNQFSIEMVAAYFSHHTCCPTAFISHFLQDRTKARRKPQKQKRKRTERGRAWSCATQLPFCILICSHVLTHSVQRM